MKNYENNCGEKRDREIHIIHPPTNFMVEVSNDCLHLFLLVLIVSTPLWKL